MKKLVAILLIFSFLFGDANHVNALFINGVLTHYRFHKRIDPKMNIAAFVRMHYMDQHGNLSQDREHAKLPFKSGTAQKSFSMLCYVSPDNRIILPEVNIEWQSGKLAPLQSRLNRGYCHAQFHPPSMA